MSESEKSRIQDGSSASTYSMEEQMTNLHKIVEEAPIGFASKNACPAPQPYIGRKVTDKGMKISSNEHGRDLHASFV